MEEETTMRYGGFIINRNHYISKNAKANMSEMDFRKSEIKIP